MSNTNNDIYHLGQGKLSCPNCHGSNWKSARMIVEEGTIKSEGSIEGNITDPGAFSGGVRELLLSDRWFSWDYDISANLEITSKTGLVESVRKFMIKKAYYKPIHKEPKAVPQPADSEPKKDTKKSFLIKGFLAAGFVSLLLTAVIGPLAWLLIIVPLFFLKKNEDEWEELLSKKHIDDKNDHEIAWRKYNKYEKLNRPYLEERKKIKHARKELRERTRVCTRCGEIYLGPKVV